MVGILAYSRSPSRSRRLSCTAIPAFGLSLTCSFVAVTRVHAQCVMGSGGAICHSSSQFERGQSPGLGEVSPDMHSDSIGLPASRPLAGAAVQLDMAYPMQQRLEPSKNSGALKTSYGSSDGSLWSSEGVLFRLDEFQNSCSINRQGPALRACN